MNSTHLRDPDRWAFLRGRLSAPTDLLVGVLAGLLIGALLIGLGPTRTAAIVLAVAYAFVLFKTPEFAILILLALVSGLLPPSFNPYFNLGVGHFQLTDLILVSLLGVTGLRLLAEREFRLRTTPLYLPLILFCLAVIGGILTAVIQSGVSFSNATYEARILFYYAAIFAVANLIRTREQARRLIYGIFAIGILVAALIVLQVGFGFSLPIILPSYFKTDLLARAYHPGFNAVFPTLMTLVCLLAFPRSRPQWIAIWLAVFVLGLSLTISLGRNIVASTLLALFAAFLLLSSSQKARWLENMLILAALAVGTFGLLQIVAPSASVLSYPEALAERFAHFFVTNPMSPEETALWRIRETGFAWEHITQHPLLGIGVETAYRPAFFQGDTLQSYIHNGYLWIWLKTGLVGLIPFLWLLIAYIARGFRQWSGVRDEFLSAAALGFTLVIFAMMFSNFVAPLLVSGFNLAFFAVGMGLVEAIFALERETA